MTGRETDIGQDEIIAGRHPVLEALRAGRDIHKIWIAEGVRRELIRPIEEEARRRGIVVQTADRRKLDQIAPGVAHQGVAAQAAAHRYAELDELLERAAAKGEPPLLLLLDEIEDPHNLGSILRTAECAGAHGIVIPKRRSAGLTAAAYKASAGAAALVPVARVTNLAQTIDRLKERGIWIAGADAAAPDDVWRADLTLPLAIVIGSEGRGIGRLIRDKCDFLVRLPMFGRINSLNASVAAGVLLYEAVRQRAAAADKGGSGVRPAERDV
ncbi:MAG: 23S rRNA (guanosine(2251)-2'-O)-methyltransferase RlmB [Thermobacillus sp. ZCTH02-B1]|uniref:23S rRNA (guanosine(2251)-2'-O)-methyltransferase RlmB n=1 Tax=Thermobacillus sp. ZCTH02-B1 TaxID=1858795 RepID=UPI000B5832C0|nr:23S rRNA (guanosine(2251)-2'-O)-methyltransferase RlmB [Thermobacillus sp. ZCTH02-B1]OUM95032.1 MAG: 23S rRNA (guanosine(2251)-2'-O)-methyltransferase RlmB [Thermobacillus sp. ZCTH02-B1]